ncbi:NAD(P)-dependent alcohol dehydrogenase [Cohnella caldifontis]|uniref:NAD(P)-dependent alcohol dehydrogenase n=1 Tax=Cohnella caldifontis TaxID=3027471 RepID=UPI0023EAF0FF|nr:NAD(P)-dependent alcohol dehydrogenase [Cohnella sp. YIM B05605]
MKAILCTRYGSPDVLQLADIRKPTPKDHEVLIKIHATTVSAGDLRVRGFHSPLLMWIPMRLFLGLRKPRNPILGAEIAGEIESVGSRVSRFRPGDRIFALTGLRLGGYAEYTCLPEKALIDAKPGNLGYDEAAAIPFGGTTALYFLRKGNIRKGCKALIYGASGAVGTSAVQLARHFGAEVTAACSAANFDWVRSLGADRVIDYTKDDFSHGGVRYDLVFDAVGKADKRTCKQALAPNGKYVTVDGQGIAKVKAEDLAFLRELAETGTFRPVIDRRYPLERIAEAHRYADTGRKRGNLVVTVARSNEND